MQPKLIANAQAFSKILPTGISAFNNTRTTKRFSLCKTESQTQFGTTGMYSFRQRLEAPSHALTKLQNASEHKTAYDDYNGSLETRSVSPCSCYLHLEPSKGCALGNFHFNFALAFFLLKLDSRLTYRFIKRKLQSFH
jgi:hypothetical protein